MAKLQSLRQLRYALVLSEQGNFTRAAAACFVTQSTLSAAIRELEESLGVVLFERDKQTVALTPAGKEVVERIRSVLALTDDLEASVQRYQKPWNGVGRLGAIPTIAPFVLPALMPMLRVTFPDVLWRVEEQQTAVLVNRVLAGRLDAAIVATPVDVRGLNLLPVHEEVLWLVGPDGDPRLSAGECPIATELVLLSEGHCLRDHTLAACRDGEPAGDLEATSLTTLLATVSQGWGITLLPEMIVRSPLLAQAKLVAVALADPAPRRGVALMYRPSFYDLAAIRSLANLTRDCVTRPAQ